MKKIVALLLAIFMMVTFISCSEAEKETEPNATKVESTLAGKTPKELYDAAIEYIKALTNYEILIESNYKTAYQDEVEEENSTTLHSCTGDTFYYLYQGKYYEEFVIHDGTKLYKKTNNVAEKSNISYEDFMNNWDSVTKDGMLIPLEESNFENKMFIHEGDLYYINLQISEDNYTELTGGSVEAPVEYRVYFNEEGLPVRFERNMIYYYDVVLVEDNIKVSFENIGNAEKAVAPEGAENFPVRLKAEEIDLSSVESLDAFEPATSETDYVLLDMKIEGSTKISETETVENYQGKILVHLFPDVAPLSVSNFKTLVGQSFYNGLTIHRVIPGFVIQGGDPEGTGQGGSENEIFGEFSANGFTNNLSHKRGVVSMARSNDPDSASSQFFICHDDALNLDGNYAAFGYVVYGMNIVDVIAGLEVDENDMPTQKVIIEKASFLKKKS